MLQRLFLSLFLASVVVACGPKTDRKTDSGIVVASVPPLETIVRELVPQGIEARSLVSPGASPHTFDLPPSGAALLEQAKLVVRIGPGFDDFAASRGKEWTYLSAIGGVNMANGHFWTDPEEVLRILPALSASLGEAFPEAKPTITERERALSDAIRTRFDFWRNQLSPVRGRSVVLFHDALKPFCERFGINVAGVVEPKPGVEPSLAELVAVAKNAERMKPRAVVSEPQLPDAPAKAMARELDVPVVQIDPYGGNSEAGYLAFMDQLVARFVEALR